MQSETEDLMAVRREMMDLLRQQVEALNSRFGLSDEKLRECYERQARVQELREKLQDDKDHGRECAQEGYAENPRPFPVDVVNCPHDYAPNDSGDLQR